MNWKFWEKWKSLAVRVSDLELTVQNLRGQPQNNVALNETLDLAEKFDALCDALGVDVVSGMQRGSTVVPRKQLLYPEIERQILSDISKEMDLLARRELLGHLNMLVDAAKTSLNSRGSSM